MAEPAAAATAVDAQLTEKVFHDAKAYLMRANKDGISVYDQLVRLMEMMLDENPNDVANDPTKFSEMINLLQQNSFVVGESTAACNEASQVPPEELSRLADNKVMFERPPPEVRTTIEQPDPYTTVTTTTTKPLTAPGYESVAQHNRYWASAGYGLPEGEAFLLDRSITRLAMEKGLAEVRFVGKIFGLRANYFIISSRRFVREGEHIFKEVNVMPRPPRKKVEVDVQPEPGFVGVNRLSFWVTSHPAAPWTLLEDVTPQQICAARQIKKYFSGDLEADVVSSPPFPWKEKVYLRAQLSRIVSGCAIAPVDALEEPEEAEDEDEVEDEDGLGSASGAHPKEAKYVPLAVPSKAFGVDGELDVADFASLKRWVHAEAFIFKNGRQTKVPERPEEDEAEEEEEDANEEEEEEEEEEEGKELFTPLQSDFLHAVVDIPLPPIIDDEEEEEEGEEEAPAESVKEEENVRPPPVMDDDVADDDETKMKVSAWTVRVVNKVSKKHQVAIVQSLRWPGATAFLAEGGKKWGSVYFGYGLKKSDFSFTPTPAPPVLLECGDVTEYVDPTPAMEKLVRRGEDLPEPDSEDEVEEVEEEEGEN